MDGWMDKPTKNTQCTRTVLYRHVVENIHASNIQYSCYHKHILKSNPNQNHWYWQIDRSWPVTTKPSINLLVQTQPSLIFQSYLIVGTCSSKLDDAQLLWSSEPQRISFARKSCSTTSATRWTQRPFLVDTSWNHLPCSAFSLTISCCHSLLRAEGKESVKKQKLDREPGQAMCRSICPAKDVSNPDSDCL